MTTLSSSRFGLRFFHRALLTAACVLPALQIGCGSESVGERELDPDEILSEAPAVENKDSSLASLGFDTALRSTNGTMMYLAGHVPAAITSGTQVRDFVAQKLAGAYQLAMGTDFVVLSDQVDDQGQRFVRLQQTHNGLTVPQGQLTVHVAPDGAVIAVLGQLVAKAAALPMVAADGERIVRSALAAWSTTAEITVHGAVEPTIFVPRNGSPQPAFRATVEYVSKLQGERALEVVYVHKVDGTVLARYSQIHDALSRQVYDLGRVCIQGGRELPGRSLMTEGGNSSDASAAAVYQGLGDTYAFFKSLFGRDSYDGRGSKLVASVHATFAGGGSGCSPNNAVWMGAPYNQMAYGDGDGRLLTDLSKALDVTGHELAHAVTGSTSGLVYQDESGALNEAMSDIHGIAVLAWKRAGSQAQPPQNGASRFTVDDHTWRVGEAVAGPSLAGGALRFMNNPTIDGYSRDFYPDRIPAGGEDNGGVHGNSGIANLAFYLLSQGGQHPRQRTSTLVNAIGFEKALRIFYTANTTLLDAHATFQSARVATAQAAQSLYGACSAEWQNTHRAWDAVGVPGAWTPCVAQGGGQTGGSPSPAPSTTIPEVKPNNTFQTAMAITQSGTSVTGQLTSLRDTGFFKMTLAAGATLNLRLDVPAKADYDLYVYNSNGTLIAKSENGLGLAETLSVRNSGSAAFTRYVRVVPYEGTLGAQSPYTLRLSW